VLATSGDVHFDPLDVPRMCEAAPAPLGKFH